MYAWSRFATEIDENGQVGKWINPGDEISQSDLGVSDEEWAELQELGAVHEEPFPPVEPGQSPSEYFRDHPDEAPEVDVDESTPVPEAMGKADAGMAAGLKPPGATEAEEAAAAADSEEKKAESSSGGGSSS